MIEPSMHERLMSLAKHVASSEDYTVEVSEGSSKGDNYMGKIYRLKIDDGEKSRNVIVKAAEGGGVLREKLPIRKAFLREIFLYEKVFVEFRKLQEEKNLEEDTFDALPKCYYTVSEETKEALVLEDLNDYDYKMWDRKKPMDEVHLKFVLRNYGKFHAFSFALKQQKPEVYRELTKDLKDIFETDPKDWPKYFSNQIGMIQDFFDEENDGEVVRKLEDLKNKSNEVEIYFQESNEFSVITHGDCWCNNMMFRYQVTTNPSTPTSIRMLDFQLSTQASLVTDLSYFFYVCAPYEAYRQLDRYLEVYHDSFSSYLRLLGTDPSVFTLQDLKDEWKKYGMHGFMAATMVFRFTLSEDDEVPDLQKMAESNDDIIDGFSGLMGQKSEKYRQRVRDLVKHMIERGLFDCMLSE